MRLLMIILTLMLMSGPVLLNGQCEIDSILIKSLLIDPTGNMDFDTNGDGVADSSDEYIEICNSAVETAVDLSGWQLGDDDSGAYPDFTFPPGTVLEASGCLLIVNDYCPTIDEPEVCDTPAGILSINLPGVALLGNSGDIITLSNDTDSNSCSIVYGNLTCDDVDPLDIPPFDINNCSSWGNDADGCPLLVEGDSCSYLPAALPVEFYSFSVHVNSSNEVELHWSTASELNNDRFELEWTTDYGRDFEKFASVKGSGTSQEIKYYTARHIDAIHGINYYRIRQVDYNGFYTYSETRSVSLDKFEEPVIAPTAFNDGFRVLGYDTGFEIRIYSADGRLVHRLQDQQEGNFIDAAFITPGFYFIQIKKGEKRYNYRVIKF